MNLDPDEIMSRREFLRRIARYALGAVLALGLGALVRRPGAACDVAEACRSCSLRATCDKPEARTARR